LAILVIVGAVVSLSKIPYMSGGYAQRSPPDRPS